MYNQQLRCFYLGFLASCWVVCRSLRAELLAVTEQFCLNWVLIALRYEGNTVHLVGRIVGASLPSSAVDAAFEVIS